MTHHYHRASVNPDGLTQAQMRNADQRELSIAQFETAEQAMNVMSLLEQWIGTHPQAQAGWSVRGSSVARGAVHIFPTYPDSDWHQEVIYFPIKCNCSETSDVNEYWSTR